MQMITHNSFRRYFNTKPNKLRRRKANKLKIKRRRQLCLNLIKKTEFNNLPRRNGRSAKSGSKKFGYQKSNRLRDREMNEHKKKAGQLFRRR
jgi:hypothetical protein